MFSKGIKGDAGIKGMLGRFGARGPVGQKVRWTWTLQSSLCVAPSEKLPVSPAGRVGRARDQWNEGKAEDKRKHVRAKLQGWRLKL